MYANIIDIIIGNYLLIGIFLSLETSPKGRNMCEKGG